MSVSTLQKADVLIHLRAVPIVAFPSPTFLSAPQAQLITPLLMEMQPAPNGQVNPPCVVLPKALVAILLLFLLPRSHATKSMAPDINVQMLSPLLAHLPIYSNQLREQHAIQEAHMLAAK